MNNASRNVLAMFFCLFGACAYAETQWYQVEIIVFAQNGKSSEAFDQTSSRIQWPVNLMELSAMPLSLEELKQEPQAYTPLQKNDWSLSAAEQTLQLQGGYKLLLHSAWLQPLDPDQVNAAVHVHADGDAGEGAILNGFIKLDSDDPLYLSADLEYKPPASDESASIYRLHEKRRIQLDEVHYLDHPKFGVIARVSLLQ